MRGAKPKPTALKLIAGNPGRRPINTEEPEYPSLSHEPPDWLSDEARAVWARLAPGLTMVGVLTEVDRDIFAIYCDMVAQYEIARREGQTMTPAFVGQIRGLASEFGLNAAARSKIVTPRKDDDQKGKGRFFAA
jgi:phage terminase small subunit